MQRNLWCPGTNGCWIHVWKGKPVSMCAPDFQQTLYCPPWKKKHYKSPLNLMSLLIHRHLNEWLLYIRESLNKENTEKRFFLYLHPVPVLPQYIYIYIFKRSCHFFRSIFEKSQFSKKTPPNQICLKNVLKSDNPILSISKKIWGNF